MGSPSAEQNTRMRCSYSTSIKVTNLHIAPLGIMTAKTSAIDVSVQSADEEQKPGLTSLTSRPQDLRITLCKQLWNRCASYEINFLVSCLH
jgi:hypothetical protein